MPRCNWAKIDSKSACPTGVAGCEHARNKRKLRSGKSACVTDAVQAYVSRRDRVAAARNGGACGKHRTYWQCYRHLRDVVDAAQTPLPPPPKNIVLPAFSPNASVHSYIKALVKTRKRVRRVGTRAQKRKTKAYAKRLLAHLRKRVAVRKKLEQGAKAVRNRELRAQVKEALAREAAGMRAQLRELVARAREKSTRARELAIFKITRTAPPSADGCPSDETFASSALWAPMYKYFKKELIRIVRQTRCDERRAKLVDPETVKASKPSRLRGSAMLKVIKTFMSGKIKFGSFEKAILGDMLGQSIHKATTMRQIVQEKKLCVLHIRIATDAGEWFDVALKVKKLDSRSEAIKESKFLRLLSLVYPGITLPMYGHAYYSNGDDHFMVSLQQYATPPPDHIIRQGLTPSLQKQLMRQLIRLMCAGCFHSDIKAANILLHYENNKVKVFLIDIDKHRCLKEVGGKRVEHLFIPMAFAMLTCGAILYRGENAFGGALTLNAGGILRDLTNAYARNQDERNWAVIVRYITFLLIGQFSAYSHHYIYMPALRCFGNTFARYLDKNINVANAMRVQLKKAKLPRGPFHVMNGFRELYRMLHAEHVGCNERRRTSKWRHPFAYWVTNTRNGLL